MGTATISHESVSVCGMASKEYPLALRFYVPEGSMVRTWTITNSPNEGHFVTTKPQQKWDAGWHEIAFAPDVPGPTSLAIDLVFETRE